MVIARARSIDGAAPGHDGGPQDLDPGAPPSGGADAAANRRTVGLGLLVLCLLVAMVPAAPLWVVLAGLTAALAFGLPLALSGAPRVAEALVPVCVILIALLSGWAPIARANGSGSVRDRTHDGGVLVTRAAADDLLHGRNPYRADFLPDLPRSWHAVQGSDGTRMTNPVRDHYPYLPAAVVIQVPFVAGANALGLLWDPRILGWLVLVATLVVLARRPEPAWMRIGALAGVGSAFTVVYLAWGTNDSLAVCLAVLALCWAEDRPRLAGAALAVAISVKVLLLVLVPPLALAVFLAGGWEAMRRWWTLPAVVAVTCAPFFLVDPGAFVDDTILFNLGKTKPLMPTSGIGLPAVAPGTFHGALLGGVTAVGLILALAIPLWAVRRWPSVWTAGAASGVALLCVMVPARTFQTNYLVLVAALLPLGWLAWAAREAAASDETIPQIEVGT
jgi:hypothetical protein